MSLMMGLLCDRFLLLCVCVCVGGGGGGAGVGGICMIVFITSNEMCHQGPA